MQRFVLAFVRRWTRIYESLCTTWPKIYPRREHSYHFKIKDHRSHCVETTLLPYRHVINAEVIEKHYGLGHVQNACEQLFSNDGAHRGVASFHPGLSEFHLIPSLAICRRRTKGEAFHLLPSSSSGRRHDLLQRIIYLVSSRCSRGERSGSNTAATARGTS